MHEDWQADPLAATASLRQATPPEPRPQPPRSREIFAPRSRAPAALTPATGAQSQALSLDLFRRPAHDLPHFNRHVQRSAAGSRSRRGTGGHLIGAFRVVHVDDPVTDQKLLRLRENTIGDRSTVFARSYQLRLIGPR